MGTRGGFLDSFHKCPDYLGSVLRLAGSRGHWHSCYLQGAEKGRQCWDGFCAPRSIKRAGLDVTSLPKLLCPQYHGGS